MLSSRPCWSAVLGILFWIALPVSSGHTSVCENTPNIGTDFDLADLFLQADTVIRGSSTTVSAVIVNCGPETVASQANLELYIVDSFTGQIVPGGPSWIATTRELEPGGGDSIQLGLRIPASFPTGGYTLRGRVFAGVNDFNANNNVREVSIYITEGCLLAPGIAFGVASTCGSTVDQPIPPPPTGGGNSGWPRPATPSITQTSATAVTVSWAAVSLEAESIYYDAVSNPVARTTRSVESYIVQYWPTLDARVPVTNTVSGNVTSVNISGLTTGTSYSFRLQATYRVIQYHMRYGSWEWIFNSLFVSNPSGIKTSIPGHFPITPANPSPPSTGPNTRSVVAPVTLTWTSGDIDGDLSGYKVYFGADRHRVETGSGTYVTTVSQSTITIPSSGISIASLTPCTTYYWRITAVDETALETRGDVWQFTTACPPTVSIDADETFGRYPLTTHFTGRGIADSGYNTLSIQSYNWEFRNAAGELDPGADPCPGSSATSQNPCHTFQSPGSYTARLRVTDNIGQVSAWVSVPIHATFNVGPEFLVRGGGGRQSMPAAAYTPGFDNGIITFSPGYLVVWTEGDTNVDSDIWAAFVRTTGTGENTIGVVIQGPFPIDQSPGIQKDPVVIYTPGGYYISWVDDSRGLNGSTGRLFDITGVRVRWPSQYSYDSPTISERFTFDLAQDSPTEETSLQRPRVALWGGTTTENSFLYVAWEKRTCSLISFPTVCTTSTFGRTLSQFRELEAVFSYLGSITALPLSERVSIVRNAAGYLVVGGSSQGCTTASDGNNNCAISGVFVDWQGTVGTPFSIATNARLFSRASTSVAFTGTTYLVVWGAGDIQGAVLDDSGTVIRPAFPIAGTTSTADGEIYPSATFDGEHFFVVWATSIASSCPTAPCVPQYKLEAARLRPAQFGSGGELLENVKLLDLSGVRVSSTDTVESPPQVIGSANGTFNIFVAWADIRNGTDRDIYGVITHAATPVVGLITPPTPPPDEPIPGVDLTVGALSLTPAILRSGTSISLDTEIRNDGTQSAGPFEARYYWATTLPVTDGTVVYTQTFGSGLGAGAALRQSLTITPPTGTDGTYYLAVVVDAANPDQVAEANELNNQSVFAVSVDSVMPSTSVVFPESGNTVRATIPVLASAEDSTGVAFVEFFLDGEKTLMDIGGPSDGWTWVWDTTLVPDGAHSLRSRAYDAAGNVGESLEVTIQVDNTQPGLSGVSVSGITSNRATITWTTSEVSDSQIEFGPTTGYGSSSAVNASLVTSHSVTITGLSPSTVYHYRAKSRDGSGNLAASGDFSFTTLGTPPCASLAFTATLTPQQTVVSLQNILNLGADVNAVRSWVGLTAFSWTAPAPAINQPVRAQHVLDLRASLNQVLSSLGLPVPTYTDGTATSLPSGTRIKAVHLTELRQQIQAACGS